MHLPNRTITRHDLIDHAATSDQVLVVVFLRGGADGLTLVPPVASDVYRRARPVLGVGAGDSIDLNGFFALNERLRPLMPHFERGHLGIIHGAGSEDNTRSHFEAQDTMEHGGTEGGSGWLGRFLRARGTNASALSAVSIGTTRPESMRGAPAGAVMQSIRDFSLGAREAEIIDQLTSLYAVEQGALGGAARDTLDAVRRLRTLRAENRAPDHGAVYPNSTFGRGLREIARLIKADVGLTATTIDLDGWDTHFVQANLIGGLMDDLGTGLDAFATDLGSEMSRVSVVVMTEFGRRLRENTSFGTDHGAGSVMFVMGRAAETCGFGGRVQSGWPDLADEHLDEVGDVPAAINYRDVLAPVMTDHSPKVELARVFPRWTAAG